MDEQIKPVAWACDQDWASFQADRQECRLFPNFYWGDDLSADADFAPLYDQQAIDTLRAEVERLIKANIAYAEQNALLQARAEHAEAEAEALRKDAERYRWLRRKVSAHGVIDGWTFAFPTHLTLPAHASAMRAPDVGLDEAIDAAKQGAE